MNLWNRGIMKKKFKCEFCGRLIQTEQCPYCGGINSIPLNPVSDAPSGKAADYYPPYPPRKGTPKENSFFGRVRTFFKVHSCLRDIVLVILFIVVVLVLSYIIWLINNNKDMPVSDTSDTIIATDKVLCLKVTSLGKEWDLKLPSSVSELSEYITFLPPIIRDPEKEDPDTDGILDLLPFRGTTLNDSYGIFSYEIINDSYDPAPFTEAICDRIRTYHSSDDKKLTSLKLNGKELINDLNSVIETFGEPSVTTKYSGTTEIEYKTTGGSFSLYFDEDDNNAFPYSIYIDNLAQNRNYF